MRFSRTTRAGVHYEMNVSERPSPEMIEALDALADAAAVRSPGDPPGPRDGSGFRIRPAEPDQDPDPEDGW